MYKIDLDKNWYTNHHKKFEGIFTFHRPREYLVCVDRAMILKNVSHRSTAVVERPEETDPHRRNSTGITDRGRDSMHHHHLRVPPHAREVQM